MQAQAMATTSNPAGLHQAHAESPPVAGLAAEELVPARLLNGGELVILAIKPSLWYIPIWSFRWILAMGLVVGLALWSEPRWTPTTSKVVMQAAIVLLLLRVGLATLQWVSRLYVLTNRRLMRIRGILNVDIFECQLPKIQNTFLRLSWYERLLRLGSIDIATAGTGVVEATWHNVPRPLEVHEAIRKAIVQSRGGRTNGLT
jgi:hypothetical protein